LETDFPGVRTQAKGLLLTGYYRRFGFSLRLLPRYKNTGKAISDTYTVKRTDPSSPA